MIWKTFTPLVLLLFFGITGFAYSEAFPLKIKFSDLESMEEVHGKNVEIRGFLYEREGLKILSHEPNLRTCCVGAKGKREKQILLSGNFETTHSNYPVTIRGLFTHMNKEKNHLQHLYQIDNAILIQDESQSGKKTIAETLSIAIGIGLLLIFIGLRQFRRGPQ